MEKYARQAINDGVTSTEELSITRDCELYRALNMHYNKANDFEVGTHLYFLVLSLCCFLNLCSLEMASNPFLCWHFTETSPSMVRSRTSVRIPPSPMISIRVLGNWPTFFPFPLAGSAPSTEDPFGHGKRELESPKKMAASVPFPEKGSPPQEAFFHTEVLARWLSWKYAMCSGILQKLFSKKV